MSAFRHRTKPSAFRSGTGPVILSATAMGLMVSPDTLALLGRLSGTGGLTAAFLLAVGVAVHLFVARRYAHVHRRYPGPSGETTLISRFLGPHVATVLPVASRVSVAIGMAAGVLVSAGFVFNETFCYRFPNFAFAYLLLGVVLAFNLMGRAVSGPAQTALVATAVCGLLSLIVIGFAGGGGQTVTVPAKIPPAPFDGSLAAVPLLLFIGYDAAGFTADADSGSPGRSMVAVILFTGVLFGLWATVSARYVPAEKLIHTTIAHIRAARAIFGENGKMLMGIVVIAGACAAVNALFLAVTRMAGGMARNRLLPAFFRQKTIVRVALAAATAAVMAGGGAGSEKLDPFIRAGLLLWLLDYAAVQLALVRAAGPARGMKRRHVAAGWYTAVILIAGAVFMAWTGPQPALVIKIVSLLCATVWIFSFIWQKRISKRLGES